MTPLKSTGWELAQDDRGPWDGPMAPGRGATVGEPAYQLTDQPTQSIVREEIRLMDRLRRGIDARIGAEVEGAERLERTGELLREDEELAALAERLHALSRSHDQSVMLSLAKLTEEEEREAEEWG